MEINLEHLQIALFDLYDAKNALPRHILKTPKDNESEETIENCINSAISFLEELESELTMATDETRANGGQA